MAARAGVFASGLDAAQRPRRELEYPFQDGVNSLEMAAGGDVAEDYTDDQMSPTTGPSQARREPKQTNGPGANGIARLDHNASQASVGGNLLPQVSAGSGRLKVQGEHLGGRVSYEPDEYPSLRYDSVNPTLVQSQYIGPIAESAYNHPDTAASYHPGLSTDSTAIARRDPRDSDQPKVSAGEDGQDIKAEHQGGGGAFRTPGNPPTKHVTLVPPGTEQQDPEWVGHREDKSPGGPKNLLSVVQEMQKPASHRNTFGTFDETSAEQHDGPEKVFLWKECCPCRKGGRGCWQWFQYVTMGSRGGKFHARDLDLRHLARTYGYETWHEVPSLEQVKLLREYLSEDDSFYLDPESHFVTVWGMIMLVALLYIAIATPYELVFVLQPHRCDPTSWFFLSNRFLDVLFVSDFIFTFFTALEERTPLGVRLIKDRCKIATGYAQSWMLTDSLATIPWDVIDCFILSGAKGLKGMRFLRFFRLARLRRLESVLVRVKDRLALDFASRTLLRFVLYTLLLSHWMACVWGAVGMSEGMAIKCYVNPGKECTPSFCDTDDSENDLEIGFANNPYRTGADFIGKSWVVNHFSGDDTSIQGNPCNLGYLYAWSLYWSIMTITSIGYGDILPRSDLELAACIFLMTVSSTAWAYVVGKACTVVMQMNPTRQEFEQHMDQLNLSMKEQRIGGQLRDKLRDYMREVKSLHQLQKSRELARKLSPKLRMDFLMHRSQRWIGKLGFLEGCNKAFIISLIETFDCRMYAKGEEISQNVVKLTIIENGSVGRGGVIMLPGDLWGEDVILYNRCLQIRAYSVALNFVQLFTLSQQQLEGLFTMFQNDKRRIRKYAVRLAFRRAAFLLGRGYISLATVYDMRSVNYFDKTNKKKKVFRANSFRDPFSAKKILEDVATNNTPEKRRSTLIGGAASRLSRISGSGGSARKSQGQRNTINSGSHSGQGSPIRPSMRE